MVRSAHSRPIAISTRWAPAGWSVGGSRPARRTRALTSCTAVWPIASTWSIAPRSALGPVPGSGGPLAILSISFASDYYAPSLDHRAIHPRDHSGRVGLGHFDEGVTLLQIDLSDAISRNSAFSSDDAHQISDLHAVARANGHEEARHPGRPSSRARPIRGLRPRGRRLIHFSQSALCPLALQHVKSGGGELSAIEFLEQRLERDDFACGNSARQHGAQLLPHRFLAIVCAPLGPVKIERGESSARQLLEPRDFARCSDDHDLNRLRLGDALQLPRSHGRLIKDHHVRWGVADIATRHGPRLIVVVVTKSSYDASCLCGRGLVASYDHSRGRIEIIQESPQGAGSGAAGDGDVLDDRHLVIGGNLWCLDIRDSHASGAPGVALGQILHHWRQLAGNDDAPGFT